MEIRKALKETLAQAPGLLEASTILLFDCNRDGGIDGCNKSLSVEEGGTISDLLRYIAAFLGSNRQDVSTGAALDGVCS